MATLSQTLDVLKLLDKVNRQGTDLLKQRSSRGENVQVSFPTNYKILNLRNTPLLITIDLGSIEDKNEVV